jgi:enediyne biosynthesis protein E4
MADVNQDGWLDIYVCVSGSSPNKKNLLFLNNHNNTFTESAGTFGIAENRSCIHASFFDFDRDDDLDLFIITNPASYENKVNHIQPRKLKGESESTDILYRNNGDNTFTDVSVEAGILVEGYSLGLAITDINQDQWPDIYISNDFVGNDILYINNQDGTFTNEARTYFKHTSFAGMGNEIADINNDGLVDVVELDMRPDDNLRQKLIIPPTGYDKFQLSLRMGYEPQFSRNTLQLNRGNNHFSEISFLAGVSSTDWSWSPLLADFDNDGDKDLFVTNGFLRDLGNMDYITYQNIYNTPLGTVQSKSDKKLSAIKALEGAALRNYVFENDGKLSFSDQSENWGLSEIGFSHGAAYADLDNDGDLDLAVNNMNAEAYVYKNNSDKINSRNFLRIKFIGSQMNRDGIGACVTIYHDSQKQFFEHFLSRGFESTVDGILHIGMDSVRVIDSLEVIWPDGRRQQLKKIRGNQLLNLDYKNAEQHSRKENENEILFSSAEEKTNIDFTHVENAFVDFKVQTLLPQMHSRNGPGIAVSDVNSDGLEDYYIGGAAQQTGALFIQQQDGKFIRNNLDESNSHADDMGILFFDADNDGDDDLYVVSGGTEEKAESEVYIDRFYINAGHGRFTGSPDAIPDIRQSGSCAIAADYDKDGDLDLFIGGRITPGSYPLPANSYILRNDSDGKTCRFTNVTNQLSPGLTKLGLVTSALWTDVDGDTWTDLLIVGEFMPITYFKNNTGKSFKKIENTSLSHTAGWWNSLTAGDYDQDGDMDYIAGNLGLNTRYKGTTDEPLCIYAKDYDKNGSLDPLMTYYVHGNKYLVHARDELISQISVMRQRFKKYQDYASVTFEESFLPSELEGAYVTCSERLETSYLENTGNGNFNIRALPIEIQFAPVYGMISNDFNQDGLLDVLAVGNSYSTEVSNGFCDASVGLYLQGDGQGNFKPLTPEASGFYADQDAKGMALLTNKNGSDLVLIGNNSHEMEAYSFTRTQKIIAVQKNDVSALVQRKNGIIYKQEFYYGSTYLSQSTRQLHIPHDAVLIEIFDVKGRSRQISINPASQ